MSKLALQMVVLISLAVAGSLSQAGGVVSQRWAVTTGFPRDTVSGEAVSEFSRTLSSFTDRAVIGSEGFDRAATLADLGGSGARQSVQVASLFAGDISGVESVFQLSMLPFEVRSLKDARDLACMATASYRQAFARKGLALLFAVPWPPTGLWSRNPIPGPSDLVNMRVRTYDKASLAVLASMAAAPKVLPIREALHQVQLGSVDAALSSGDGQSGRELGNELRNFTAIRYAYPLSFMVVQQSALDALAPKARDAVLRAAAQTEEHMWRGLPARIQRDYDQMKAQRVTVVDPAGPALIEALRRAGQQQVAAWLASVPADQATVLNTYRDRSKKCMPAPAAVSARVTTAQ